MAELTPEIAPQVFEACKTNAEEAAGALGRSLDGEFVLKPGDPVAHDPAAGPLQGPGLAVLFQFGSGDDRRGAVALLAASSGLAPDWCKAPDPTGESKLSTLAQELSMLLMPDDLMADEFSAAWVDDLAAAVARAEPAEGAQAAPIELASGETLGELRLIWPLAAPGALFSSEAAAEAPTESPAEQGASDQAPQPPAEEKPAAPQAAPTPPQATVYRAPQVVVRDLTDLPPNSRSILRVTVPVSVHLASKKLPINEIVELAPGAIITFEKPCDDDLEIAVGGRPIAHGEAVKVGEKFGVRLREMILPHEHFRPMLPATPE